MRKTTPSNYLAMNINPDQHENTSADDDKDKITKTHQLEKMYILAKGTTEPTVECFCQNPLLQLKVQIFVARLSNPPATDGFGCSALICQNVVNIALISQ